MSPLMSPRMSPPAEGVRVPVPSNTLEWWHAEKALTPAAWVGQLRGLTLLGVGTPTVAADGAFFRGRPAAQTFATGKYWSGTFSAVALTGTRPWIYVVARSRTIDATSRNIVVISGGGIELGIIRNRTSSATGVWNAAASVTSAGAGDTSVHKYSTWLDGTNLNLKLDTSTTQAVYAPALLADLTTVTIGTSPLAGGREHDASIVLLVIAAGKPPTAEEAALDAYSAATWF